MFQENIKFQIIIYKIIFLRARKERGGRKREREREGRREGEKENDTCRAACLTSSICTLVLLASGCDRRQTNLNEDYTACNLVRG